MIGTLRTAGAAQNFLLKKMKRVEIHLPEADIKLLDDIAKEAGTTRAGIIRSSLDSKGFSSDSMNRISSALRRRLCGTFSAQQAEQAAAIAICAIANESRKAA